MTLFRSNWVEMEKLLADRVPFVAGMPIWSFTTLTHESWMPNFLDKYYIEKPHCRKKTDRLELFFKESFVDEVGKKIPDQWMIRFSDDYAISLDCFYSSEESAIFHAILNTESPDRLLKIYREDYLIEEFKKNFNID